MNALTQRTYIVTSTHHHLTVAQLCKSCDLHHWNSDRLQIKQKPGPHRGELCTAARLVGPHRHGGEHRLHRVLDGQAGHHPHGHGQAGRGPRPQALPELTLRPQLQEGDREPGRQFNRNTFTVV